MKEQLCWECKNACGNCEWSASLTVTKDITVDGDGFIVACRKYVPDVPAIVNITPHRKIAKRLGISIRTFYYSKKYHLNCYALMIKQEGLKAIS